MGEIEGSADLSTFGIYIYNFSADREAIGEDFSFCYFAAMELAPADGTGRGSAAPPGEAAFGGEPPLPSLPTGMEVLRLEAADYAVFEHRGFLRDLGSTYRYIYKTWFPRQGAELAPAPFFERRGPDYPGDRPGALTEIWIPIRS